MLILSVGLDEHDLKVDELKQLYKTTPIHAVYVTPHHQFSSTLTMTQSGA